ncbi:TIGR03943 family protein [Paenibacillus sp. MWE-103]|uniref:TIGR03943 family protein n=1 Tax=Paenibacillus artemisiicola TaxID=1172618 RepID=A0ABS3WBM6_9BACL|nr:TIGR03943 family protein [Paenibacillus artemisiicola]MBO7745715.1 TIGR03943 family protein [Paenibacillus artemisiicola]
MLNAIREDRRLAWHYGFRGLLLGGFAVYIAHLAKSGRLQYYIAPRTMLYVKLAALGLFVLAVYFVYEALRLRFGWAEEGAGDCGCEHPPARSIWRNAVLYALFAAPLAFGFALPDKAMGSDVAAVKGMRLDAAGAVSRVKAPAASPAAGAARAGASPAAGEAPSAASGGVGSAAGHAGAAGQAADSADAGAAPGRAEAGAGKSADAAAAAERSGVGSATPAGAGSAGDGDASGQAENGAGESAGRSAAPDAGAGPATGQAEAAAGDDAQLAKRFPHDEYGADLAALGMRLYGQDLISVRAEGFLEKATTLSMYMDNFQGKTLDVSGFVYREPDMKPDQFIVSRLAMTCCSADAVPYGFLVEGAGTGLKADTWVRVKGEIGKTVYGGNTILRIKAASVAKIAAPKDPYVYPYVGDLSKLAG